MTHHELNIGRITAFLDGREIKYEADLEDGLFVFGMRLRNVAAVARVRVDQEMNRVTMLVIWPLNAPANRRAAVAEFAHRMNLAARNGTFLFDPDDGELGYRLGIEGGDEGVDPDRLEQAFVLCAVTVDALAGVVTAVMGGGLPASSAAEQAEAEFRTFVQENVITPDQEDEDGAEDERDEDRPPGAN